MNSATEKERLSARLRRRRFLERQRRKLHESLIAKSLPVVADPGEFLLAVGEEAGIGFLAGGTVASRTAIHRALRRQQITAPQDPGNFTPRIVARPTWVLRERHRPAVFP